MPQNDRRGDQTSIAPNGYRLYEYPRIILLLRICELQEGPRGIQAEPDLLQPDSPRHGAAEVHQVFGSRLLYGFSLQQPLAHPL